MSKVIEKVIAILNGFYDGDGLPRNVGIGEQYLKEIISELEAQKDKSCNGCIMERTYNIFGNDCFMCSRHYSDKYDPKATK